MEIIEKLNKRYASKAMNGCKISDDKKEVILESIRLAPTSLGLQAFKIIVVEDKDTKQKIFDIAAQGQPQIPNSSFTLVFAIPENMTTDMVDDYFADIRKVRNLPEEKIQSYRKMVESSLNQPKESLKIWTSKQVYIALGFALYTAALLDVDSVPIEGFNKEKLDDVLKLKEQNLTSVCMMAVGIRNEELDYNARLPKVRKSKEKIFIHI
jgi:nitroreductase / dihydropteridine reductase